MAGSPCGGQHQFHLGGRDVFGEDTAHPAPIMMDFEHDLGRSIQVMTEIFLQNHDDEFHGGEIIVQQQDFIEPWGLGFLRDTFDGGRSVAVFTAWLMRRRHWRLTGEIWHVLILSTAGSPRRYKSHLATDKENARLE